MEVHDLSRSLESISWRIYENVEFLSHIGKVRPCNKIYKNLAFSNITN